MKKNLSILSLVIFGSLFSQNIAFDKLYGNSDPIHYYLNHYPVTGSDGLDINWYGGIRLQTSVGVGIQLLNNGNVGIGTTDPKAPLDVQGRILINPELPVWGVGIKGYDTYWSRGYNFMSSDGTVNLGGFSAVGPKDKIDRLFVGKAWDETIADFYPLDKKTVFNGNVGIGTNNPAYKLDVKGTISSQDNTNEGGAIVLDNIIKTSPNTARKWVIYNMTGQYGNSLQFWNYSADGAMYGSRLKLSDDGNMALYGKIEAKEVKVTLTPTADFVFEKDYNLPKLEDIEKHILEKKHLPEIASAKVMEKEGVNVGDFQIKLLQKIEELTLYVIQLNKDVKRLEEENKKLNKNDTLTQ